MRRFNSTKSLRTAVKKAYGKIDYLEHHDFLTGTKNLTVIREQLKIILEYNETCNIAVLVLGIDDFNVINATRGSETGDTLLVMLARRIVDFFQNNTIVARKGGDEFVIFLRDYQSDQLRITTKKLLKILSQPYLVEDEQIFLTVSIGISRCRLDAQAPEELLANADIALQKAKQLGKHNYQFFTFKMGREAHQTQKIQMHLAQALELNEFFLCYQPQIILKNQQIIGVEALLRWQCQQLGLIYPDLFIHIAEKMGFITAIGDWVLHQACQQLKKWQNINQQLRMAVNVSCNQLLEPRRGKKHFLTVVQKALKESKLAPEFLELEITENIMLYSDSTTLDILKKLKDLGVRIACDDFGVGYASFSRLKHMPFDTIKIDRSLIKNMFKNKIDVSIIRAILSISNQLNMNVVAEGVENKIQSDILNELGCNVMQGNFFSKAITVKKMEQLLNVDAIHRSSS